jgi:hypothetical protein
MLLTIFGKIIWIHLMIVANFDTEASTILNTYQSIPFLPEWTKSVYKTEKMAKPSMILCASVCNLEFDDKCSFFYLSTSTCYLGNLTLGISALVIPADPTNLLINESKYPLAQNIFYYF